MALQLYHFIPVHADDHASDYVLIEYHEIDLNPKLRLFFRSYLFDDAKSGAFKLYHKKLGFQRNGVSKKFYQYFASGFYFNIEDCNKVYTALKGDKTQPLQELQKNFQNNFISNFSPGKSVLFVNY